MTHTDCVRRPAGETFPPCPGMAALILAAGRSSRMGMSKPLLRLGGETLLERVIGIAGGAGVEDILIVLGHEADRILPVLSGKNVRIIVNPDYERGMFSSLQTGVRNLPLNCRGFFVLPADMPRIRPSTLTRLHASFQEPGTLVCRPRFRGRRGHPPLLSTALIPAILAYDGVGGLRTLLTVFEKWSLNVDVDDPGVLVDLDTPADFDANV